MLCVISPNRVNTSQESLTRVRHAFSVLRTLRSVEAERVVVERLACVIVEQEERRERWNAKTYFTSIGRSCEEE